MGRYLCSTLLESSSYTSCLTIPSVTLQMKAFGDKQGELKEALRTQSGLY
jgi:hypothetical protein